MANTLSARLPVAAARRGPTALLGWLAARFVAEQDRWVLWLPVFMGAGIGIYFTLPDEPGLWMPISAVSGAVCMTWIVRNKPGWRMLGMLLVAAGLGFGAAQVRTLTKDTSMLVKPLRFTVVTGVVLAVERFPDSQRVLMTAEQLDPAPRLTTGGALETVRLRLRGDQPRINPGQRVRIRAGLLPPPGPAAPGAFDFQRHAYFKAIGAVGYGLGRAEVLPARRTKGVYTGVSIWWAEARLALTDRIRSSIPGEAGAVAAALITGDRSGISEATLRDIRNAGLAHLLAISGLHVGLVAGFIFFWVRAALALWPAVALRYPIKKWAAAVAIGGALVYTLLAGATVPTQRAFIMIALVFLAVMADRRGISLRTVAWAAVVVMIMQPEAVLGPSFQMSFAAVVALIAAYEVQNDYGGGLMRRSDQGLVRRGMVYLAGIAFSTLIAGAATGVFAAFHFNAVASFSLVANMIAVPLTALWIMPWAVLGVVLTPTGLEDLALAMMGWGIEALLVWAKTVSEWSGSVIRIPSIPVWGALCAAFGGLWLCLWRGPWRLFGIGGLVACALSLWLTDTPDILVDSQARVVALKTKDGGYILSSLRAGRRTAESWLRRAGARPHLEAWRRNHGKEEVGIVCDRLACRAIVKSKTVAIVNHPAALGEDCRNSHIVISAVPVRARCEADVVVGRFDVWRNGAYGLWIAQNGEIRVQSVNGARGHRPWVIRPAQYKRRSAE